MHTPHMQDVTQSSNVEALLTKGPKPCFIDLMLVQWEQVREALDL